MDCQNRSTHIIGIHKLVSQKILKYNIYFITVIITFVGIKEFYYNVIINNMLVSKYIIKT